MARLAGKVAIVTGAAMGLGEATAKLFAQEGAKVVIADISETAGKRVIKEIIRDGGKAVFARLNVSREEDWQRAIDKAIKSYGKLNILVNNAGVTSVNNIEDTTLEEWNKIMSINATGVYLGTKYGILAMKDNGENCSIINRSSISGLVGEAGFFAYAASKGAVTLLTKSAAIHCGEKGYKIRVNSVHPAIIHTPLTEKEAEDTILQGFLK